MFDYKTAAEKSVEWEISLQKVQSLCRKEKIIGAEKHGGVWFIPTGANNPFHIKTRNA